MLLEQERVLDTQQADSPEAGSPIITPTKHLNTQKLDELTALYQTHAGPIEKYIANIVGLDKAPDLVQQTFCKALAGFEEFRAVGRPLLPWLYKIAHNSAIDLLRHDKIRPSVPLDKINEGDLPSVTDSSDLVEKIVNKEKIMALRQALVGLSPKYRDVIMLRFVQDLSITEIARLLGCPEGTIKANQHRAIKSLRRQVLSQEV